MNDFNAVFRVSLIGRPNVGKSMLFNALTKTNSALVHSIEGVTRDRKSDRCSTALTDLPIVIDDLGGLTDAMFLAKTFRQSDPNSSITQQMLQQAMEAVKASDCIFFVVDARAGVCPSDQEILSWLRKTVSADRIWLVLNKAEFVQNEEEMWANFYELGLGQGHLISAAHRQGLGSLIEHLESFLLKTSTTDHVSLNSEETCDDAETRIAFIGRPNVGKSTLVNAFLNRPRMITSALAGTTREAIDSSWDHQGNSRVLVDTAGIRKKSAIVEKLEYLGVNKAFTEIESADIVVLVLDANQAGERQDLIILQKILEQGRAVIVALNKSDNFTAEEMKQKKLNLLQELRFALYLPIIEISAKYQKGLKQLFQKIFFVESEIKRKYSTALLNRLLQSILQENPPSICKKTNKRIRIKYIHQSGYRPLKFVIRGNQLHALSSSYKKFLEKKLRQGLNIAHIPILMGFENQSNPYATSKDNEEKQQD